MISSLYIHIPFCDCICNYCDFAKVLKGTFSQDRYIDCLINDIESLKIKDQSLKTIYIGGGTPTCLSDSNLKRLLEYLNRHFYYPEEFTVEANPESLTKRKVSLLSEYGVNRISLGVQSSNPKTLHYLGRNHTNGEVIKAVRLLNEAGLKNYNLDFIYGVDDLKDDINFAFSLNPTHLSFYSLQIEDSTVFHNKNIQALDDETMAKMYSCINYLLPQEGYHRYEVSNFAQKGYESIHNLNYWHDGQYYAAGLSSSGYINDTRYKNTLSLTDYLKGINKRTFDKITEKDHEFEYLMLNLRLVNGFNLDEFANLFKKDFLTDYSANLENLKGDFSIKNQRFMIKKSKLFIMDSILLNLLK